MLVLEVNGKKERCPVCWEECTVRIFQRLVSDLKEGDDAVKVFSILTGTSYSKLWESDQEDLEAAIYQATAFVFNQVPEFKQQPTPKTFKLGGRVVTLPGKIARLTVGQNFQMRQELMKASKEGRSPESLLSIAMAIYLQPIVDASGFNMDRARELEEEILDMNIFDVYPAAFFLLNRLQSSGTTGTGYWLANLMRLPKWWPKLPRWRSLSRLVTCFSLTAMLITTDNCQELCRGNLLMSSCLSSWHGSSVKNTTGDMPKRRSN